ncbi:MAG: hypothetical protein CK424_07680 [Legionella sp.]|nr:MAG: hypothetical protein CK424_07680 [Legionella sp.]
MRAWHAFGLCLFLATKVLATPISTFVIFGDSLSDSGNSYEYSQHHIPAAPWYYQGRFSNGPIWTDYLLDAYFPQTRNQHILSYAFGGAGVLQTKGKSFTLTQEVDSYLLGHSSSSAHHNLFIIWIGANDYLMDPHATLKKIEQVVKVIQQNIERLLKHGATQFMILSLPDLGGLPFAQELELGPQLSQITEQHNHLLKEMVHTMHERYPRVDWVYVDAHQLWRDVMQHPEKYKLTRSKEACMSILTESVQTKKPDNSCVGHVFFDQFHPTTYIHDLLAQEMIVRLQHLDVRNISSKK